MSRQVAQAARLAFRSTFNEEKRRGVPRPWTEEPGTTLNGGGESWWNQILLPSRSLTARPLNSYLSNRKGSSSNPSFFRGERGGTPWKMNGWNLQITHLERKMIWTKHPWLCSMLIFRCKWVNFRQSCRFSSKLIPFLHPELNHFFVKANGHQKRRWPFVYDDTFLEMIHQLISLATLKKIIPCNFRCFSKLVKNYKALLNQLSSSLWHFDVHRLILNPDLTWWK